MSWREHIDRHPEVIGGKPKIKGTRIGVRLILQRLGDGWSFEQVVDAYPGLSTEQIRACQSFAAEMLATDEVIDIPHADRRAPIIGGTA